MKQILSTLVLTLVISPAFAVRGGFGVGGPESYEFGPRSRKHLLR